MRISDWSSDVCSSDLRVLQTLLRDPQRRLLQAAERLRQRRHELGQLRPGHTGLDVGPHGMEEAAQQAAHVLAKLAADEVQGLDAVGAPVDLRDARVAHELLHDVLADVAVGGLDLPAQIRERGRAPGWDRACKYV